MPSIQENTDFSDKPITKSWPQTAQGKELNIKGTGQTRNERRLVTCDQKGKEKQDLGRIAEKEESPNDLLR